MPTFSANLGCPFPKVPFVERLAAARACSFGAVELMFPSALIAYSPERHELGTGELNSGVVLAELDRLGYDGRIGLRRRPSGSAAERLGGVGANR